MKEYKMTGIRAAAAATRKIDARVERVQIEWDPKTDQISTYTPSRNGWFEPDDPETIVLMAIQPMTTKEIRQGLTLLKDLKECPL